MMRSDWTWVDLGNPCPKDQPSQYLPIAWPDGARVRLEQSGQASPELSDILHRRRTRRTFEAPASIEDLATLFKLCCRTQMVGESNLGFDLEYRPYPASGAIHSIHMLIQRTTNDDWMRYDPRTHELISLPKSKVAADAARITASQLVDTSKATLIAFVAEPGKTAAKYAFPDSLIWRDAGVLLGYLSIGAEALGLHFCPLGITGEPHLGSVLDQEGRLHGVGMALLGRTGSE